MGISLLGLLAVVAYVTITVVDAGPRCFECRDISSPLECGVATECSDNQECYVDQLVSSGGLVLYNTGCRSKQLCGASGKRSVSLSGRQTTDLITCSQCCQGEFCNEQGCGIKAPLTRGPNCFQCTNMLYTSECRKVVTCELGQLCVIYEVNRAGTTVYDSTCESERVCNVLATLPQPIGRRRQTGGQLCHVCCKGDYCNDNCNATTATVAMPTTSRTITSVSTTETSTMTTQTTTQFTTTVTTTPTTTTATTLAAVTPEQCKQNGFSYASFVPICFKVTTQPLSWHLAEGACRLYGGTLAVVDTLLKWQFLKIILSQEAALTHQSVWLGARDVDHNNTYYWTTGQAVGFNNWLNGIPGGFMSSHVGGKCLSALAGGNFLWHNLDCSKIGPFVCTKPVKI